ncbi:MAG TPA: hypothetical protein PK581_03930 [Caldisericia bacterium]|nr:hypothetical protein [Caldisericia bacterium]
MDRASLRHLCDLCALELNQEEEESLLGDLLRIAHEFEVLSELPPIQDSENTQRVFFRDDHPQELSEEDRQILIKNFPIQSESYLLMPALDETDASSDT